MKIYKNIYIGILTSLMVIPTMNLQAGNEDRAGSAGSTELLVNPWTRSSGWGDAGVSSIIGLEAMFTNVAGLAYADQTEIIFSRYSILCRSNFFLINSISFALKAM